MLCFFRKIKIPVSVLCAAAVLIGVAFLISSVHRGRDRVLTIINESFSGVNESENTAVRDIFAFDAVLPEKYKNEKPLTIATEQCKKYTQITASTDTAQITVKTYVLAHFIEDEAEEYAKNAEIFTWGNIDYFLTENDGKCSVFYYYEKSAYFITDNCTTEEMIANILN